MASGVHFCRRVMKMLVAFLVLSLLVEVTLCKEAPNALGYLRTYGYISRASARSSVPDVTEAIKKFQKFSHIPVTGRLDNATISLMGKARCGMPDVTDDARQKRYSLKTKWSKNHLTYYVQPGKDLPHDKQREIFADALKLWADVSQLTFSEVSSPSDADIKISFGSGTHSGTSVEETCNHPFDGPYNNYGYVLAHAYDPPKGRAHFDEDEYFTDGSHNGINLFWVAVHEFGHSLGLKHSNIEDAIMYPYYPGYKPNLQLHSDDIAGIQILYGPSPSNACFKKPIGVSDPAKIPDNQMTAFSYYNYKGYYVPGNGRLNGNRGCAWCASEAFNDNDWLQVDLGRTFQLCGIATQGAREICGDYWVKVVKLSYSTDGNDWTTYKDGYGFEERFSKHSATGTEGIAFFELSGPVSARFVRFHPAFSLTWNCLRVEVYGE